jgi:hypothetical protein
LLRAGLRREENASKKNFLFAALKGPLFHPGVSGFCVGAGAFDFLHVASVASLCCARAAGARKKCFFILFTRPSMAVLPPNCGNSGATHGNRRHPRQGRDRSAGSHDMARESGNELKIRCSWCMKSFFLENNFLENNA